MLSFTVYPSWAHLQNVEVASAPLQCQREGWGKGHLQAETVFPAHDSLSEHLSLEQGPVWAGHLAQGPSCSSPSDAGWEAAKTEVWTTDFGVLQAWMQFPPLDAQPWASH